MSGFYGGSVVVRVRLGENRLMWGRNAHLPEELQGI